jgi:sugar transferase (PEP-CTERM/EpsH1 system associated)
MKVLFLSPHIPALLTGATTRDYYMLKALASQHEVTLLTLNMNGAQGIAPDLEALTPLVSSMQIVKVAQPRWKRWSQLFAFLRGRSYAISRGVVPELQAAIDQAVEQERYDLIWYEGSILAGYRVPAGIPVVIDEHNLEFELCWRTYQRTRPGLRKLYNRLEAQRLKPVELKRCQEASLVCLTSEREYSELTRLLPSCVAAVVPNGVDTSHFSPPAPEEEDEYHIVFSGSMDYYPNTDAVLFFARHCWPLIRAALPQARWTIVGKNPPPSVHNLAQLPGVYVTGSVKDVRPYLTSASLTIAPLLIGSGTRLKILESFAMGKAVVSSRLGCEGINVEHGRELLIADQPEDFAAAVVRLLRDPLTRRSLGEAGRQLVEREYSWTISGQRLLAALESILVPQEAASRG